MTLKTFISGLIVQLVTPAIELMFAAAIVFFLWNVFKLIKNADQAKEVAELKSKMAWGLVAIATMASVWGLVTLIRDSTGLNNDAVIIIRTGP